MTPYIVPLFETSNRRHSVKPTYVFAHLARPIPSTLIFRALQTHQHALAHGTLKTLKFLIITHAIYVP